MGQDERDGSCGEVKSAAGDHVNRTLGEVSADTGGSQGAVTPDKAAIAGGEPQETLQLHPESRLGPIHHHSHLPGIHLYIPCSNAVTKEGDGGAMEFTLFLFHIKLVLKEVLEDLLNVEHVFLG